MRITYEQQLSNLIALLLDNCVAVAHDGTRLFTPDGMSNYDALWTRDFCYMLEYAPTFITDEEARAAIEYLIKGARADGWIPDRVYADGTPVYAAGSVENPVGKPNLDNACFLVIAADVYLSRIDHEYANETFLEWYDTLLCGLDALPVGDNGLIYNDPAAPHSPYGFTDCVGKTGYLFMESLLLWRARWRMHKWLHRCGIEYAAHEKAARLIEKNIPIVFVDKRHNNMPLAATVDCAQIDVWGACYALTTGFPFAERQRVDMANWLIAHHGELLQHGQLRHTAPGETWQRLLADIPYGEYQNGAYWATAAPWYIEAIYYYDMPLAERTFDELMAYLFDVGAYECVNGDYRKLDQYVCSATNAYPLLRLFE